MKNPLWKQLTAAILGIMMSLMMLLSVPAAAEQQAEDPFADWNKDAPALKTLIGYVEAVTDESSPDFIPPADRIATFDMDGTLCAELYPTYLEYYLLERRIFCDPSYTPDEEMLEFGCMLRDHAPDKSLPDGMDVLHGEHAAKAYAGMTLTEFADFVTKQLVREADGFEGMTYANSFYTPMVEVVEYLQDNGFKVYVCSGSDRYLCRTFIEGVMDIPYEQIIGMDVDVEATNEDGQDGLKYVFTSEDKIIRTDRMQIKNLKMNKVKAIVKEIGRQPVLSFGNSSGDVSMHNYTLFNNKYRSAAFMLIADDSERDYGSAEKVQPLKEKWEESGYQVISMKNDFRTIYGDEVKKTATFRWMEEFAEPVNAPAGKEAKYDLEQVVILSRHNLRAPLSSNGSVPNELTPHAWINWSANSSELTMKGGVEETSMGQYFSKWLDREGLIPMNSIPAEGEVRFSSRTKQRCRATARYFAAGLFPLADIKVEYPKEEKGADDFMAPVLHFSDDRYAADATAEVAAVGGEKGFDGIAEQARDTIRLIMDTVDMTESEAYKSGKYGDLLKDGFGYVVGETGTEPDFTGAIKAAYQVADALLLQYYEEPDAVRAAFGHELTEEDWAKLGRFMTYCLELKHGAPMVSVNITHPLIQELEKEFKNEKRKLTFFCAHDCTVLGTLSALGAKLDALPGSIETKAPIGVKLVFERRRDEKGQVWYKASMVYRSTEQIRSGEMLTEDNPPMKYDLSFEGVETNEDGLISEADFFALLERTNTAYDIMESAYALDNAA